MLYAWIPFMIWLLLFEIIADIGAKQFELTTSRYRYAGALACYMWGNALRLFAMHHGVWLGRGTIIFGVVSTIITLLIAYGWYKEPISMVNIIGIVLCLVGLILLDRS